MNTTERLRGVNPVEDAKEAWAKMDKNQRALVRFGMTDITIAREFGYHPKTAKDPQTDPDLSRRFAVALMDEATRDGGMRA